MQRPGHAGRISRIAEKVDALMGGEGQQIRLPGNRYPGATQGAMS